MHICFARAPDHPSNHSLPIDPESPQHTHRPDARLRKNPECPVCGTHRTITKLIDYEQFCGIRGEPV